MRLILLPSTLQEIELARAIAKQQEAAHISNAEREMRGLFEHHLQTATKHQDTLSERIRELEATATEAMGQCHKIGEENYALQEQLMSLEHSSRASIRALSDRETELMEQVTALKNELAASRSNTETLYETIAQLKSSVANESTTARHNKQSAAMLAREKVILEARIADHADDEDLMVQSTTQLKETIALLTSEKQNLLKQKSGEVSTYAEEVAVLRQAMEAAQRETEASITQVRTEKNQIMLEAQDLAEQLAGANAEIQALYRQLESSELAAAKAMAHKDVLEGEKRFLESENRELSGTENQDYLVGVVGGYVSRAGSRGNYASRYL